MSLNDQFNMGRIPIRPLSLTDKNLAQTKEFIIDNLGDNPTYHIFVADDKDRTKLIDITDLIIKEILYPSISADNMQITIEGAEISPDTLRNIINFIYKRFLMPDDPNGFDYERDYLKITDILTKNILLKDTDGIIYLPITTADNVYDSSGISMQDRLDNMTRVAFSTSFVRATTNNQTSFQFEYPFLNYPNVGFLEVRIGSTYIDKYRYEIINEKDSDGNILQTATLNLIDESLENGRAINILFMYNSADTSGGKPRYLSGQFIADGSIPIGKMEKVSDRYDLNDSTSVATNKAVYNVYKKCCELLNIDPSSPSTTNYKVASSRCYHTSLEDDENGGKVYYTSLNIDNPSTGEIVVYRNGIRLFESVDYTINRTERYITVFVRIEQDERFTFEVFNEIKGV